MSDTATISEELKGLGDKIAELTLKQAKELSDYLKDEYNIEPAAGGAVMVAARAAAKAEAAEAEEKTDFDVVLTNAGEKRVNVVKAVKDLTGASLMDAKKLVDAVPATIKEGIPKEEAESVKAKLEEAGGSVELK